MNLSGTDTVRLLATVPPMRRARNWRLYSLEGKRYIDFWLDGGRGILGAGKAAGGASRLLKEAIDTGMTRPVPSVWNARLAKEIATRWPGYSTFRIFQNEDQARSALARSALARSAHGSGSEGYQEERTGSGSPETLPLYAEYFASDTGNSSPAACPILPCPAVFSPCILLFRKEEDAQAVHSTLPSPVTCMSLLKSFAAFDRFALSYREEHWSGVDARIKNLFERRGPYLFPVYAEKDHDLVFARALEGGIILPPVYGWPALIPGEYTPGELAPLATLQG